MSKHPNIDPKAERWGAYLASLKSHVIQRRGGGYWTGAEWSPDLAEAKVYPLWATADRAGAATGERYVVGYRLPDGTFATGEWA